MVGEAAIESGPAQTEQSRGFGSIASCLVERTQKSGALIVTGNGLEHGRVSMWLGARDFRRQVRDTDPRALAADRGELDRTLEFANIAGPGIGEEQTQSLRTDLVDPFTHGGPNLSQECAGQQGNIIAPVSQGRELDARDANTIEQIGSKGSSDDVLAQVVMSRGQHANVYLSWFGLAQSRDLFFLQHTEQACLYVERDIADLIEKHRATVSRLEEPRLVDDRSGKGAARMAKELAAEQGVCESGAVRCDKRSLFACTGHMNRPCDQLLARPGFALD